MRVPFRYQLTDAEKDALLRDQAALIEAQAAMLADLQKRILELEAGLSKPRKTSRNLSKPPSTDFKGGGSGDGGSGKKKPSKRRDGPGVSRRLAENPDKTVQVAANACDKCGADVSGQVQTVRHRYDHIDIPPVMPHTTWIELLGGRCRCCAGRFKAPEPEGMLPGTPFGPNIRADLLYLHHSHHVGFERLSRLMLERFGLSISEGAIASSFKRQVAPLETASEAIKETLRKAAVIASDETTTRINGATFWPLRRAKWSFVSETAILHEIAPSRAKAIAERVLGDHRPEVWVSDRYAGQQELAGCHQVCLAHVLHNVQYAIDCGDTVFAPKMRDLLLWTIGIGRRRDQLKDSTLGQYHAKAERRFDRLLGVRAAHPAEKTLQAQAKAWRIKFFVFLQDRRAPATNNISEREIRPSVIFRKVTGGFRSEWGAAVHAGYRSVVSTARIHGQTALQAIERIVTGKTLKMPTT